MDSPLKDSGGGQVITPPLRQQRWEGGRIHIQKDGRELYTLEKRLPGTKGKPGKRIHISTRCHNRRDALKHLDRFEANPFQYLEDMRSGPANVADLRLTRALALEYRKWLLSRPKPTTTKYANEMAHRLNDWVEDLRGCDLRHLRLAQIKARLNERGTSRQHRIIALKGLMAWLRTELHRVDRKEDVTLDLEVPQAERHRHAEHKAVDAARVRAVFPLLGPRYQDMLLLAASTGWHLTEVERFIRDPDGEIIYPPPNRRRGKIIGAVRTWHKTKKHVTTAIVEPEVLAAAERLKAAGTVPRYPTKTLKAACRKAGVEPFGFGVMRHSVASWAKAKRHSDQEIADFLSHADVKTTRGHYIHEEFPATYVELPRLSAALKSS